MNILTIVVPCYNEESVLEETTRQLSHVIEELVDEKILSNQSMILFVNDGSSDNTWSLIEKFHSINKYVCGVKLAKNEGHQNNDDLDAQIPGITLHHCPPPIRLMNTSPSSVVIFKSSSLTSSMRKV